MEAIPKETIFPLKGSRKELKAQRILKCLKEDFRMSLTAMSRKTGMPVSTIYDMLKEIRQYLDFEVRRKDRNDLVQVNGTISVCGARR